MRYLTALLVLAVTGGCAGGGSPAPLSEVNGKTSVVCVQPRAGERVYTYGHDMARNRSEAPVTIKTVEFSSSDGLEMIDKRAVFTKTTPERAVGVLRGWPPDSEVKGLPAPTEYLKAPRAEGLVVPPDAKNPVSWMIAFRVERLPARAAPLVITYEDEDGREYTWHGSVSVKVGDCGFADPPAA
jgi:hypothetical protein